MKNKFTPDTHYACYLMSPLWGCAALEPRPTGRGHMGWPMWGCSLCELPGVSAGALVAALAVRRVPAFEAFA